MTKHTKQPSIICVTCGKRRTRQAGSHETHARFAKRSYCSRECMNTRPSSSVGERMSAYFTRTDGCWIWTGATDARGYGVIGLGRRKDGIMPAHVASYETHEGQVPEGMVLDHLCRNPSCINPDHLEPVTLAENSRRGSRAKITRQQADSIKQAVDGGRTQVSVADEYGLHPAHVSRIVSGKRWAEDSESLPMNRLRTSLT